MSGDSVAKSEHTPSIHMGSDDYLSSPRMEYSSDDLSISDKSSSSESLLSEASPLG